MEAPLVSIGRNRKSPREFPSLACPAVAYWRRRKGLGVGTRQVGPNEGQRLPSTYDIS